MDKPKIAAWVFMAEQDHSYSIAVSLDVDTDIALMNRTSAHDVKFIAKRAYLSIDEANNRCAKLHKLHKDKRMNGGWFALDWMDIHLFASGTFRLISDLETSLQHRVPSDLEEYTREEVAAILRPFYDRLAALRKEYQDTIYKYGWNKGFNKYGN